MNEMSEHDAKWAAFFAAQPHKFQLKGDQHFAMFRHAWDNPDRNYKEYRAVLVEWQQKRMEQSP